MTNDEACQADRDRLSDAQRAMIDLYGLVLVNVMESHRDPAGLVVMSHPDKPLRQLCLYGSLPIGEWMRNMKLFMDPDEHAGHLLADVYGTLSISPRGYGKPCR